PFHAGRSRTKSLSSVTMSSWRYDTGSAALAGERFEGGTRQADPAAPAGLRGLLHEQIQIELLGRVHHLVHAEAVAHRLAAGSTETFISVSSPATSARYPVSLTLSCNPSRLMRSRIDCR